MQQGAPHVYDVWEHTLNVVERLNGVLTTISPARTEESAADSAFGMIVYLLDRFRKPLQAHLAQSFANSRMQGLLMLAALLHDAGKPPTQSISDTGHIHFYEHEMVGAEMAVERATALHLSNDEIERLSTIIRHHMRPMLLTMQTDTQLSRRTVHRFWKATGEVGVDICMLTLADYLGKFGVTLVLQDWIHYLQIVGALLEGYFQQRESVVAPPPLVTGHDLISSLALRPGPLIGQILSAISEAQGAGEISTVEEAMALAKTMLENSDAHSAGM
jgi:putative nucleotidyltransferase with HDIG domain